MFKVPTAGITVSNFVEKAKTIKRGSSEAAQNFEMTRKSWRERA
jgi:hypothetical protein